MEEKKSKTPLIIGIIIVVVIGIFVWKYFGGKQAPTGGEMGGEQTSEIKKLKSSITMVDQKPGRFVNVKSAVFGAKGFVTIHEDKADEPGAAIGSSSILPTGETRNLSVTLNRKSVAGEYLYAMLHSDDGDGIFNPAKDEMIKDEGGNPVMAKFLIRMDADEPIEFKM